MSIDSRMGGPTWDIGAPNMVPVLTFYLLLLLGLPSSMVVATLGFIGGPATVFALGVFCAGVLHALSRSTPVDRGTQTVEWAMAAMLFVWLIAYAHSAGLALPADERRITDAALISLTGFCAIGVATARLRRRDDAWALARNLSMLAGALALLGLLQLVTAKIFVDKIAIPGLTPPVLEALQTRGAGIRPSGTSTHPLEYASVLVMTLPIVLVVAGATRRHRSRYVAIAALVSVVIFMSGSRTSLVCGLVAFVALLPAWSIVTRLVASCALLLMASAMFVLRPGFLGSIGRLFSGASADPGVQSRTNSYDVVAEYIATHPLLGRGPGTFLPKYWIIDNQYLQTLLGAGLIGLMVMAAMISTAVVVAGRAARRVRHASDRKLALAVRAAILAGATSFAFFDAFSFGQTVGVFFLVMGLGGSLLKIGSVERGWRPDGASPSDGVAASAITAEPRSFAA